MESVLFVTWDGGGNVPPALGIAGELTRRGKRVRFLGHPSQRAAIEAAGFEAEDFRHAKPWSVLDARSGPKAALGYAGVFTDRGMGEDLVASVRSTPTGRVVIDGLLLGAMAGAARAGVPYVVLVHTLNGIMHASLNRGPLALITRTRGLNPARLYGHAERVLAATVDELDFGPRDNVVHTGPVLGETGRSGVRAGRPASAESVVLVSLSTTFIEGQREALQRILDALGALPAHVVVTTGPAIDPSGLRTAANAEVHGYLPHGPLMETASLVVTHGGHATTMLALAHGLPLLVMPMNPLFDQPTIGKVIAEHGLGLTLGKKAAPAEIRAAVEWLLPPASRFREKAQALGARMASQDGAALASDLLEAEVGVRQA